MGLVDASAAGVPANEPENIALSASDTFTSSGSPFSATASIIQPTASVTNAPLPNFLTPPPVPQYPPYQATGYQYTAADYNSGFWTYYAGQVFHENIGPPAELTPGWAEFKSTTQGIAIAAFSAATGVLAGEAVVGWLGAETAGTLAGTSLVGAVGGATGNGVQNALTQLSSGQPFSVSSLGGSIVNGAGYGAVLGGVFNLAGAAIGALAGNFSGEAASDVSAADAQAADSLAASCFRAGTKVLRARDMKAIETIRVGQRVLTGVHDLAATNIKPEEYRQVRLRAVHEGREVNMTFLRPAKLFEGVGPGDFIHLSVLELLLDCNARILSIDPCPPIEEGPGRVVTGTFDSQSSDVRMVKLVGLDEPVSITGNHPIYSVKHEAFVRVNKLGAGDELRTAEGGAELIESTKPEVGHWAVFNLEVEGAHQYYVTERHVLVHNANGVTGIDAVANPQDIRFTQPTASPNFSDGYTIDGTARDLSDGMSPAEIPTIRVVQRDDGEFYTLDNRRLVAYQAAGLDSIPIKILSLDNPDVLDEFLEKFNPIENGTKIVITPSAGRTAAEALLRQMGKIL